MIKIPIYNEEWLASSQCLFSVHYSCHTQHISGKYYFFTRFTYLCNHVSYMNICRQLAPKHEKQDIQWSLQLSNVYRHTKKILRANEQIYIPFSWGNHRHTKRGHHCVLFPLCCFHPVSLQWRPMVSKHTQKYTDTHQDMHKCTFGQDLSHPLLSICGVFKHQSRVV